MRRISLLAGLAALLCGLTPAVGQRPLDGDRAALPVGQTPVPNGFRDLPSGGRRPAWIVRDIRVWADGRHTIGSASQPCDLVIESGGHLQIERSFVAVHGDVVIRAGGHLRLEDTDFRIQARGAKEYNVYWEGGHVETRRVAIGGNPTTRAVSNLYVDEGLWTAHDTVFSYSGGIILGSRNGRNGNPLRRGGTLIADGLFPGEVGDFVHLSSRGDVTLRNSACGIVLRFPDTGPTPRPVRLDLGIDRLFGGPVVFGDPVVHDGTNRPAVTNPVPGSLWRLELEQTTVTSWRVAFYDAGPGFNRRTYELLNAEQITIGVHAVDLSGRPELIGPWRTYYPNPQPLPGLPTAAPPGHHGIPPGCGVRIGQLTLMSPRDSWSRVTSWGLYLDGPTSFEVVGPSRLGEIYLWDTQLTLRGAGGYDGGLRCATAVMSGRSRLTVRDGMLGTEEIQPAEIFASGRAVADLQRVTLRNLRLRTGAQTHVGPNRGVDAGRITIDDWVPSNLDGETRQVLPSSGGTITLPAAETDNADFAASWSGATPPRWNVASATARSTSDVRPGAGDSRAARYESTASSGKLSRSMRLSPGATLEAFAWVKPVRLPSSGTVELVVRGSSGRVVRAPVPTVLGQWRQVALPLYDVASGDSTVAFEIAHSGTSGRVELIVDDVEFVFPQFWESDNLLNQDFDSSRVRQAGAVPFDVIAPDYWRILEGVAGTTTSGLRSGASGRAARLVGTKNKIVLRKDLTRLAPGQTVRFRGWVRSVGALPGAVRVEIHVGEGDRYWNHSGTPNVYQRLNDPSSWTRFDVTYTVPGAPFKEEFTVLAIAGGARDDVLFVDDVEITIR